jgi:hypothetical protein
VKAQLHGMGLDRLGDKVREGDSTKGTYIIVDKVISILERKK